MRELQARINDFDYSIIPFYNSFFLCVAPIRSYLDLIQIDYILVVGTFSVHFWDIILLQYPALQLSLEKVWRLCWSAQQKLLFLRRKSLHFYDISWFVECSCFVLLLNIHLGRFTQWVVGTYLVIELGWKDAIEHWVYKCLWHIFNIYFFIYWKQFYLKFFSSF